MNNEFALQCLKFAYDTIGYENLMKELLFMKYNEHIVSDPEPEKLEKSNEQESDEEESDEYEESHENIYCEKVFKNGRRCMIKTVDNSKYCNRHK